MASICHNHFKKYKLYALKTQIMENNQKRVGVFLYVDEKKRTAAFIGVGNFVGCEVPDENAKGVCPALRELGRENPKILLDNGKIVWGGECWWQNETETKELLKILKQSNFKITTVDIDDVRSLQ